MLPVVQTSRTPGRLPAPKPATRALATLGPLRAGDALLAAYRGSEEADAAARADPATPPRLRLALLVRAPERRALVACRDAARAISNS